MESSVPSPPQPLPADFDAGADCGRGKIELGLAIDEGLPNLGSDPPVIVGGGQSSDACLAAAVGGSRIDQVNAKILGQRQQAGQFAITGQFERSWIFDPFPPAKLGAAQGKGADLGSARAKLPQFHCPTISHGGRATAGGGCSDTGVSGAADSSAGVALDGLPPSSVRAFASESETGARGTRAAPSFLSPEQHYQHNCWG